MTSPRRLVFLGRGGGNSCSSPDSSGEPVNRGEAATGEPGACHRGAGEATSPPLLHEGHPLSQGESLPLVRKRSPWNAHRGVDRVIVGSHPARADVLLEGEGIRPEHVRIYIPLREAGPADLLPIEGAATLVGGRVLDPRDWTSLEGGEELQLGAWLFRFESGA